MSAASHSAVSTLGPNLAVADIQMTTPGAEASSVGPIMLFDGQCNFCHSAVRFLIEHDATGGSLRFASLQSEVGRSLLAAHHLPPDYNKSMVLIESSEGGGQRALLASDASLRAMRFMRQPWRCLSALRFIPRFIRDPIYAAVAKSRYRLFGRRDSCSIEVWKKCQESEKKGS